MTENKPIVIFAAGGRGTRIQSLNATVPKPMIPIAGKPILQWGIECLVAQGYKDFIVTVSHLASVIMDYFGDGSSLGCKIEYFLEEQPLGNAGALFKLWESGIINGSFFYFIADAIFSIDCDRYWNYHKRHNAFATLFTHPNSHPHDSSLVIHNEDGVITNWLNKEDERPQWYKNSVNSGLHILTTELLEKSDIDPNSVGVEEGQRCVDLDRDVLKPLISTYKIMAYTSSEYVKDAGTPERFHAVEHDIKSGRVAARNLKKPQRAIFIDRDGTINKYIGFLRRAEDFELLPGVGEAIRLINQSDYLAIVVTNQPVIARGEVTFAELELIHSKMETLLGEQGAYLDSIFVCPHHPHSGFPGEVSELKVDCNCRKPKPGLLLKAASYYNIDLEQSWMIGDSWRDIEAGKAAGCKSVMLNGDGTEYFEAGADSGGDDGLESKNSVPLLIARDILEAVKMIFEMQD